MIPGCRARCAGRSLARRARRRPSGGQSRLRLLLLRRPLLPNDGELQPARGLNPGFEIEDGSWLFRRRTGFGSAYVGSANLSGAALMGGLEWTVKSTGRGQTDLLCTLREPDAAYGVQGERERRLLQSNRSLSGVLCPPAPTRNNPSHIHQGGAGSDQGDSDQQQVAAA